jgi:hypothetical protein
VQLCPQDSNLAGEFQETVEAEIASERWYAARNGAIFMGDDPKVPQVFDPPRHKGWSLYPQSVYHDSLDGYASWD